MTILQTFPNVTNSVSMREEFNKDFVTFVPKPSWRGIEKNLKFMTKAGHGVQSAGERIIADRLYECGIDYVYDSLIEIDGEWSQYRIGQPATEVLAPRKRPQETREENHEVLQVGVIPAMVFAVWSTTTRPR